MWGAGDPLSTLLHDLFSLVNTRGDQESGAGHTHTHHRHRPSELALVVRPYATPYPCARQCRHPLLLLMASRPQRPQRPSTMQELFPGKDTASAAPSPGHSRRHSRVIQGEPHVTYYHHTNTRYRPNIHVSLPNTHLYFCIQARLQASVGARARSDSMPVRTRKMSGTEDLLRQIDSKITNDIRGL